jgi:hypothetical protein
MRSAGTVVLLCVLLKLSLSASNPGADSHVSSAESKSVNVEASLPVVVAPIQDNSFLIEEAYNQEDGVIQHISFVQRSLVSGDWMYTQTDEWPIRSLKHQLSLTMSAVHSGTDAGSGFGFGDTALNYRYQLVGNGEAKLAIAPRFSLLIPTGNFRLGHGIGGAGLQTNFPVSVQHSRWLVTHWNAGLTWVPSARNSSGEEAGLLDVNLGESVVWLASHRFNALLETLWTSTEDVTGRNKTNRRQDLYVSPGIRWAHNFQSGVQIVPGFAVPIGVGPSSGQRGIIFYLSFEHPWRIAHSH